MSESDLDMKPAPQREEALFQAAAQLTGSERAIFLDSACRGDNALRQRIDALLQAHTAKDSFLEPEERKTDVELPKTVALQPPGDEALGQVIGRYKLREKVGEGGCGV